MTFTPFAILAESSSGSTWLNHVLSSHPCVVSVGEFLMSNRSAANIFDSANEVHITELLNHITARNVAALRLRDTTQCTHTAGGVKLKLVERDVTFGQHGGNALQVAAALGNAGYHVLILHRMNHLDKLLGRLSRRRTGVLHCRNGTSLAKPRRAARSSACEGSRLNLSVNLRCERAKSTIDGYRLRKRACDGLFRSWTSERLLKVEYEQLVDTPSIWLSALRLLGIPAAGACALTDEFQKRVRQTQRELVRNYDALRACFQRAGSVYTTLLQPDRRPSSGVLPKASAELCPI